MFRSFLGQMSKDMVGTLYINRSTVSVASVEPEARDI